MDMVVAHAADGKLDGVLRFGIRLLSGLGYFMDDMASANRCFGQCSQHSCGTHCLEKRTPVATIILPWCNSYRGCVFPYGSRFLDGWIVRHVPSDDCLFSCRAL